MPSFPVLPESEGFFIIRLRAGLSIVNPFREFVLRNTIERSVMKTILLPENTFLLGCLLGLVCGVTACSQLTPDREVTLLRAELGIASTKCAVYLLETQKYPRNPTVTDKCTKLTAP